MNNDIYSNLPVARSVEQLAKVLQIGRSTGWNSLSEGFPLKGKLTAAQSIPLKNTLATRTDVLNNSI